MLMSGEDFFDESSDSCATMSDECLEVSSFPVFFRPAESSWEKSVEVVSVHVSEDDFCKDSSDLVSPISTTLLMFPFLSDSVG